MAQVDGSTWGGAIIGGMVERKVLKAMADPTAGWSDEKIIREFIEFAQRSADDSGPSQDMADQATLALRRLVDGTGSTEADAKIVSAIAVLESAAADCMFLGVKSTRLEMLSAQSALVTAAEDLREALATAGSHARTRMSAQIQHAKNVSSDAIQRIAAHLFR